MGRVPAKNDTAAPAFLVACIFFAFFGFSSAVTVPAAAASSPPITCGSGTFLDESVCVWDGIGDTRGIEHQLRKLELEDDASQPQTLQILGLLDTENPPWAAEVFNYTMQMLNDHTDGWHDDVLNDGTALSWTIRDTSCDATTASRAYWADRTQNGNRPSHGIVGCRCSGATLAVARIADLEAVPQISFASTSAELSDDEDFPYFARTVSPDESAAIVAALRGFGWDRMTLLYTDTPYAQGLATSVKRLWTGSHSDDSGAWTGTVAYSYALGMKQDGSIDGDSVRRALEGVPTDDPTINSRVVLLISHDQDAFHVLRIAAETEFQPDTIWVGCPAWSAQFPPDGDLSGIPYGAIGVTPYRNRNTGYQEFLEHVQKAQIRDKKTPWDELLGYEAEHMADSVVAMVMALSNTKVEDRRNGAIVMSELLDIKFEGVSGSVSFTPEGDRQNPLFSLVNLKPGMMWENVGNVGLQPGSADIYLRDVCFAVDGCNLSSAPDDSYPVPPDRVPVWVIITLSVIGGVLVLATIKYCIVIHRQPQQRCE